MEPNQFKSLMEILGKINISLDKIAEQLRNQNNVATSNIDNDSIPAISNE